MQRVVEQRFAARTQRRELLHDRVRVGAAVVSVAGHAGSVTGAEPRRQHDDCESHECEHPTDSVRG